MTYNKDNISLLLAQQLSDKVNAAWESGEMMESVTPVTRELLQYWFCDPFTEERTVNFHIGQRQAILNTIYLHDVVKVQTVEDNYSAVMPDEMGQVDIAALTQEKYQLPKYAIKMATGTGKTWVMHALVLWQLLNARHTSGDRYTQKFLLIAPGSIVYDRLQDAYLGKVENGDRKVETSDLHRFQDLFLPPQYREEVFNFVQTNTVSKEQGIGRKATGEGMIAITNWHLFLQKDNDEEEDLIDELLPLRPGTAAGNTLDTLDRRYLRGTEAEYLHDLDNLMVINDEAHHVHENGSDEDDVQWQQALDYILQGKKCRMQVDFSATPYEQRGTGRKTREIFFPHIIVDFDLKDAMQHGLVKTLSLDQRQSLTELKDLDYNAIREGRNVIALSEGQKLMLRAGIERLNRLQTDFAGQKHPKMLVVCEDTKVTPLVEQYLVMEGLKPEEVLRVDSDAKGNMKEDEWKRVSERLSNVDRYAEPRVIVSVMMLREGFDVNNICVIVPLRSSTSNILLEQTIGRGLRLMWREPEYDEPKLENRHRLLVEKREPLNYMDILFIVEHPRFRQFYDDLINGGLATVDTGKSSANAMGDMVTAELKDGYEKYDFAWLNILRESEELLELPMPDVSRMEIFSAYTLEQLRRYLATDGETFVSQAVAMKTTFGKFNVKADLFSAESYREYLQKILRTITHQQANEFPTMQMGGSMLMQTLDKYIRTRLFGQSFDPFNKNDWKILLAQNGVVTQHIVKVMATALYDLQLKVQTTEAEVDETIFSSVEKIPVREQYSLEFKKTIYTRTAFPSHGGGLERSFMEFIDSDGEVERWIKVSETRHRFAIISYMRTDGLLATYHPDFLVGTANKVYMIETKGQDKVRDRNVQQKRRAAVEWCDKINILPAEKRDGKEWEYILIGENEFYGLSRNGATFEDICQRCRISLSMVQGELKFE
ncbi:MAG: DEAD/DEAH box helicase family protein [Bacteroidales bacterium]|nr:DEAD/DEAH box helicase family protein [Bacteroidales bacterium]